MSRLGPLVRVQAVEPLTAFNVRLTFQNGAQKEIDLAPYMRGPIFAPMRNDIAIFRTIKVSGSTIGWENGTDIDPDVLYYGLTPAWAEEAAKA